MVYSNKVIIRNSKHSFFFLVSTGAKNEYRVVSANSEKRSITVVSTSGQIVKKFYSEGIGGGTITLNNLPPAIYSIVIQQADKKEIRKAFVY